jgi:hypothetical protein
VPKLVCLSLIVICSGWFVGDALAQEAGCPTTTGNSVCLTTYQGGANRLGFNPNEPALTEAAITATTGPTFHKQFSVPVNGAVYGQPLVLPNVSIGGVTYADVVYVATEQDWVYAIDGGTGNILWATNLAPPGYIPLVSSDLKCSNILPPPGYIGISHSLQLQTVAGCVERDRRRKRRQRGAALRRHRHWRSLQQDHV